VLEYRQHKKNVEVRWKTDVKNFTMPVEYTINGKPSRLNANNDWQKLPVKTTSDKVNFNTKKMYFKTAEMQ
nr:M1 family peptidase [Flavobacterium sp.]